MTRRLALSLLAILALAPVSFGGEEAKKPPPPPPPAPTGGPSVVVHVPADELDVLLKGQGKGMLLRYGEYAELRDAARAKSETAAGQPPVDGALLSAAGTLDLTGEKAATFSLVYRVRGLAPGPRAIPFASAGVALESVEASADPGSGTARYEEKDGQGRLFLDGPGTYRVEVKGSVALPRAGSQRALDLTFPDASAFALEVKLPPGVEATLTGEGAARVAKSPAEAPLVVSLRPARGGRLLVAWADAAKGTEGPSVLDAEVKTLHTVGDGVVQSSVLVKVDVLRTPTDQLVLEIPEDLSIRGVEGPGVTGSGRSEDRRRLTVRLEAPRLGPVELLLQAERPYKPGPGVELPRIAVAGALRQRGEVALRLAPDLNVRDVRVEEGRRVALAGQTPERAGVLRYALARSTGGVTLDLEPGRLRVDATSTYYLNLAEPGQTLLATATYRVVEGTLFRLSPRFPPEFDLRTLTLNGSTEGFTRDASGDGVIEITLAQGVGVGGEIQLLATLERAKADWLPEKETVSVPFAVPSAGVTREEGYAAVGADAGFEVLQTGATNLLSVGAADLTARGLSAAGLVYGYRLDGESPSVALAVTRREPLITADVVTVLHPGPRRLDLAARAVYRIQRAGVRRLYMDVPSWAGEQVDFDAPWFRTATRLTGERRPADVPAGYDRWQIDLEQRAIGTHVVMALWFLDRTEDDWKLEADRVLAARAPVDRAERLLVVRRSTGLEVSVPSLATAPDARALDITELPPEASVDPSTVLEVLRLTGERSSLALSVTKHGGAAVLDAIATEVGLETAVGAEGILRTRAQLDLFNVDRQFVAARLPAGSELIGAVVDGVPVKPLVDPRGQLLITVPTARARDARTRVVLTYDTHLDGPVEGHLTVAEPQFPGLEVLHTTHRLAVEDGLEIAHVGGDLRSTGIERGPVRRPWIFGALASVGSRRSSGFDLATQDFDFGAPSASARDSAELRANIARHGEALNRGGEGGRGRLVREPSDPTGMPPPRPTPSSGPVPDGPATPGAPPPATSTPPPTVPPPPEAAPREAGADDHNETDNDMEREARERAMEEGRPDGDRFANEPAHKPAGGGGPVGGRPRQGPGEGGEGPPEPGFTRKARKGQLSLDVPVAMGPVQIVAQRVGGGGSVELTLVSKQGRDRTQQVLLLVTLALGLFVLWRGWLPGWLTVLALAAVALCVHVSFGADGSLASAAVADGATALAALLVLRGLGRLLFGRRAPAAPVAVALVLVALTCALAAPAHADEAEDAAERSPATAPGGTVFVPHDPARGTGLAPDDRVFVPMATWLELQRQAFPERDPELVSLGQVAALRSVAYELEVDKKQAQGRARLVLAQRGRGTLLVLLPFPGLAITEARLNDQPVRLLLDGTSYRVALEREGEHVLELVFQVPMVSESWGRYLVLGGPPFAGATLDVRAGDFGGDLYVSGAGRVDIQSTPASGATFSARAYLGRVEQAHVSLVEKTPATLPAAVRTRAETRTVHSLRDGGTETVVNLDLHVLQGQAPFVELDLPEGVDVLEAGGPNVQRWETASGRLRLVFNQPLSNGRFPFVVRTFRAATSPQRSESLPELAVRDTTGESGLVVVNGDASLRLEADAGGTLFRTSRPTEPDAAGRDGQGRVLGGWRFAARPAPLSVKSERAVSRVEVRTLARVTFGDDRVRSLIEARVTVLRAPLGELIFALPGNGEVRSVEAQDLQTWWVEGTHEERTLHVRLGELFEGERVVNVSLERRLGGSRDGLVAPRLELVGSAADRGELVLFTLPDVEPAPGAVPGLKALLPQRLAGFTPNVEGARATHAYAWEEAVKAGLPLVLRTPEQEVEAVVVTQVSPGDEEQRLEHLVLFDVRRGAVERLSLFVPDGGGGLAENDVVRARDMREVRWERATTTGPDGKDLIGRLYSVRLQSPRSGLIEVTVSQLWPAGSPVFVVKPEGVKATRWFGLVRTFLDGEVAVSVVAGSPDVATWADLPFLPTGLSESAVVKTYAARAPYALSVMAHRHPLVDQAQAVVLQALAEVVLGLDGEARVRMAYRVYNRSRQFLRVKLPAGAVLYGAFAAGRPVKPLAGVENSILLPVPKVPLGGTGYEVGITYRAKAGSALYTGGDASLVLPTVDGAEVDRTAVAVWVPESFRYTFETKMSPAEERDVFGERAQVVLSEVRDVLEVAKSGTLDQRLFACSNGAPLLAEAWKQVETYKNLGGKAEVVAGLEQEFKKLSDVNRVAMEKCQIDLGAAQNEVLLVQNIDRAGNNAGQQLVDLDAAKEQPASGAGEAQQEVAPGQTSANWRFNAQSVPLDKAGKEDLVELKERLQSELSRRDSEERRKSVDVKDEEKNREAQGKSKSPAKQQARADEATVNFDSGRNNLALNDALKRVQVQQRQLGAEGVPQFQGQEINLYPSNFTPHGTPEPGVSTFGFTSHGQSAFRDSGVFYSDAEGDGSFRGRTENIFERPLGRVAGLTDFIPPSIQLVGPDSVRNEGHPLFGAEGETPLLGYGRTGRVVAGSGGSGGGGGGVDEAAFERYRNVYGQRGQVDIAQASNIAVPGGAPRVGLMGVDVDLPKVGRVYWFLSAKTGSALNLSATPEGTSPWMRGLLCVALLAFVGLGLALYIRRRRAAVAV